jgi:hypothetical protein
MIANAMAVRHHESNPRTLGDLLRRVPISQQSLEVTTNPSVKHDARSDATG